LEGSSWWRRVSLAYSLAATRLDCESPGANQKEAVQGFPWTAGRGPYSPKTLDRSAVDRRETTASGVVFMCHDGRLRAT